jgi:hypothetical protein
VAAALARFERPVSGLQGVSLSTGRGIQLAEILPPRFEVLGGPANLLPEHHKRLPGRMRVEIGQTRCFEGIPKDPPDRRCIAPTGSPGQRVRAAYSPLQQHGVLTTFSSDGTVSRGRQAEIIRSLAAVDAAKVWSTKAELLRLIESMPGGQRKI